MATPAQPATSAVFRALRSVDVAPDLAYEAAEEVRHEAGQNVITVVEAQNAGLKAEFTEFKAELKAEFVEFKAELKAEVNELRAELKSDVSELRAELKSEVSEIKAESAEIRSEVKAQGARIDAVGIQIEALGSRIDTLQRVIWPLVGLLATTVFGLLYKAVVG